MGLRSLFSATMVAGLLLIGSVSPASADDSPPVTTPGAPTGTRSAPAGGASPGAAKAAAPSCSYQRFCISKDTYFNGPTYRFTTANSNWSLVSYANLYNEDSSWASRWTVPVTVYDYTNYGGGRTICVNVNWNVYCATGANDRGSSHKWDGRSAC
jgi:hypothetical protein